MAAPTPPQVNSRANKLADKLGLQNRAEIQALQTLVRSTPGEVAADQILISPMTKIKRLQNILGAESTAEYMQQLDSGDSGTRAIKLKKNASHVKRMTLSQELLNETADMTLMAGQEFIEDEVDDESGAETESGSEQRSTAGIVRHDSPGSSPEGRAPNGNRARTGKLADFFGVQDDNVGQLRRMVDKSRTTDKRQNKPVVPTFLVRVHFANETHVIMAAPIDTTAKDMAGQVLRKLMIHDDEENYGLFVINAGVGDYCLKDAMKVYDVVRAWNGSEYIMFRRRGKSEYTKSQILTENELLDDSSSKGNARASTDTVAQGKSRKVSKLAMFFGVSVDNKKIKEEQAEIEDLLNMLNESMEVEEVEPLANTWRRQTISENTIVKEGWLNIDVPDANESAAWVSLEKETLHVRYCASRESAISPHDPVISTKLNSIITTIPSQHRNTFVLTNTETGVVAYTFSAHSMQDRDDWTQVINKLASSLNSSAVSQKDSRIRPELRSRTASGRRATIDDFEFHRVLGKGKYGKVLLCSHRVSKKVFAIKVIQKDDESESTAMRESEILRSIKHPFIVGLHYAFQNIERLYLVMEYINGGELFFHLSQSGRFAEKRAKFYAAEILLALQCLHGKGIVYRDLKLENILLDKDGHVKIADFGLSHISSKDDKERTFSMAGTLEYFAPEVIEGVNYSFPADWWAFGVILFELLAGYHPFYNPNPEILYKLILKAPLEFPAFVTGKAADLITRLLDRDYQKRLGSGPQGSRNIQQHPFFKEIDWFKLFRKEIEPPWRPELEGELDVRFFDSEFTSEAIEDNDVKGKSGHYIDDS